MAIIGHNYVKSLSTMGSAFLPETAHGISQSKIHFALTLTVFETN